MKYVEEFRDAALVRTLADRIRARLTRRWTVMEVCGGQTHTLLRCGLDDLLTPGLELVHGPGCPVCVTGIDTIDKALAIAARPGVILCSYGDMLRVPGSREDLFQVRASGGDVRVVYSPLDALRLAQKHPGREVVFFAVGFETTAPAHALALLEAERTGAGNFSMLVSHVLVPPALRAILGARANRVEGLIAPGHVCAVTGLAAYEALADEFQVPIVVGGFEPVDLMEAASMLVEMLEGGRAGVENQYARSVARPGNAAAMAAVNAVFEVCDRAWRGIGTIAASGLRLRGEWSRFDAEARFRPEAAPVVEAAECLSAEVLQGLRKPTDCPAFAGACTPERPLGAPMVSNEGACAAYYLYKREEAVR